MFAARTFPIPDFPGGDRPARPMPPEGVRANALSRDRDGLPRLGAPVPGAHGGLTPADAALAMRLSAGLLRANVSDLARLNVLDAASTGRVDTADAARILRAVMGL